MIYQQKLAEPNMQNETEKTMNISEKMLNTLKLDGVYGVV